MRIVHVSLRYPPATGGVETYVRETVERTRNLTERRDVRVLTSKMRTHGPITELKPAQLLNDPPYVQRLHHARTPFISYPRLQALNYYISHHRPDILTAYSFWYQPADAAARYAKKHGVPLIFYPMYYENKLRRKLIWQIYKKTIGPGTFAAADVVAVISPYEQSLIERAGFPVKRFELLPPGVDIEKLSRREPSPYQTKNITGPVLLSVGRIARGKGLADTIKAMPEILKEVSNANLVIAGEDFGAKAELKRLAAQLGLTDRVHFWGKLTADQLAAAYQHADVFIHASYYEAFGIVLAEAMAAGAPVVARNTAAIPYVVNDGQAGRLFKTQADLIQNVIDLLKNPSERQRLTQAGRQHVADNFTWPRTISRLQNLYQELKQK